MKNLGLLVWLTQLGLSVVLPLVGFILLALWLRDSCGWGGWVLWVGIGLGVFCAIDSFRVSLKTMDRMIHDKKEEEKNVSFNEHD